MHSVFLSGPAAKSEAWFGAGSTVILKAWLGGQPGPASCRPAGPGRVGTLDALKHSNTKCGSVNSQLYLSRLYLLPSDGE